MNFDSVIASKEYINGNIILRLFHCRDRLL